MVSTILSRRSRLAATAIAALVSFGAAGSLGSAKSRAAPPAAPGPKPQYATYELPSQVKWTGRAGAAETAVLMGDPSKEGLYIELVKWYPHNNSRPHFHP